MRCEWRKSIAREQRKEAKRERANEREWVYKATSARVVALGSRRMPCGEVYERRREVGEWPRRTLRFATKVHLRQVFPLLHKYIDRLVGRHGVGLRRCARW